MRPQEGSGQAGAATMPSPGLGLAQRSGKRGSTLAGGRRQGLARTGGARRGASASLLLLLLLLGLLSVVCSANGAKFMLIVNEDEEPQAPEQQQQDQGDAAGEAGGQAGADPAAAGAGESEFWRWEGEAGAGEDGSGQGGAAAGSSRANWSEELVHPGWWRRDYETSPSKVKEGVRAGKLEALYSFGIKKLLGGIGCTRDMPEAMRLLGEAASRGGPVAAHAQSALGFMHGMGLGTHPSRTKAFLYHSFAARNGSIYSKLALAYDYLRQQNYNKAVVLYSEVAEHSMAANSVPGKAGLVEMVRLNDGVEENKDATRFQKGEDDETMQYIEFSADKGNIHMMRMMARFLYWGARGMPRDHARALAYFRRAAELGDVYSMLTLGEMLARGVGTPGETEDPEAAMKWFKQAAEKGHTPAYNGMGFLYARGKGVLQNYTKAAELFRKGGPDGLYNLGVMHLRGLGVPRRPREALKCFQRAVWQTSAMGGTEMHMGALFFLARMHQKGLGTPQDLQKATTLYKAVAEQGPWGALLRWAHDCYMGRCGPGRGARRSGSSGVNMAVSVTGLGRGSHTMLGMSFLLYARAAELGYEVAQSNAAWLLDRLGKSGALGPKLSAQPQAQQKPRTVEHGSPAAVGILGQNPPAEQQSEPAQGGGGAAGEAKLEPAEASWPVRGVSGGAACVGASGYPCSTEERQARSHRLWRLASEQGNVQATLIVGDAYFYGRGTAKNLEKAVDAYRKAKDEKPGSAQAMFNLGYMHERGLGLPADLYLAKRYYDEALATNPNAFLPVYLALAALWLRMNHPGSVLVKGLDLLPDLALEMSGATEAVLEQLQDDGNRALLTLVALLAAVLFLRSHLRRPNANAAPPADGAADPAAPAPIPGAFGEAGAAQ